jgi:hypothetical protein
MIKKSTFICAIAFQFCGCYYFTNPQPVNQPNINSVPKSLWGTWVEGSDTTIIEQDRYYHKSQDYFKWSLDKKDEVKIIGEKIYMLDYSCFRNPNPVYTGKIISLTKDSAEGITYHFDANFINHDFILKKVDIGFLLNSRHSGDWWNPELIIQEKDTLKQYSLNDEKMKSLVDSSHVIFTVSQGDHATSELREKKIVDVNLTSSINDVYINLNWSLEEWNDKIANGIFEDDPNTTRIRLKF